KKRSRIDFQIQQVSNGIGIFGAVKPMQQRTSGIRMRLSRTIQFSCQPRCESQRCRTFRMESTGWRHDSGIDLTDNLFPDLCVFGGVREIKLIEGNRYKALRLGIFVVTGKAILVEKGLLRGNRLRTSRGNRKRQPS